jgi:predicted DNA-binding ribbon-helix-helix protein
MPHASLKWKHALAAAGEFTGLLNRNIQLAVRRTSFRPDPLTWRALQEIARREGVTVGELCNAVAEVKPRATSLTAAIRVAVLRYYMDAATEDGHKEAGHGNIGHMASKGNGDKKT